MDSLILLGASRSGVNLVSFVLNSEPSTKLDSTDNLRSILASVNTVDRCKTLIKQFKESCQPQTIYPLIIDYELYKAIGIQVIDGLNAIIKSMPLKLIWIARDPLSSCGSYTHNMGLSVYDALQYWHDINLCIYYVAKSLDPKPFCLKFEDLFLHQKSISNMFEFAGLTFDKQYLRYQDFDQPKLNTPASTKGKLDVESLDYYRKDGIGPSWANFRDTFITQHLSYDRKTYD